LAGKSRAPCASVKAGTKEGTLAADLDQCPGDVPLTLSAAVYARLRQDLGDAAPPPGGKLRIAMACTRHGVTGAGVDWLNEKTRTS
jgi:hypothetical protein